MRARVEFLVEPLEQIQRRWPEIAAALASAQPGRTWGLTQTPVPTLRVGEINITSCYDREREANLQASRIPEASEEAWVYGVALGDLQRALLSRPALQRLHVVIMSRAVERKSFEVADHPWLADPRVTLHHGAVDDVREPFACAPASVWTAERDRQSLRDRLLTALAAPMIRAFEARQEESIKRALAVNAAHLSSDPDVETLRGKHAGAECYVIAAGPTFDEVVEWLRPRVAEGVVVAVNTAVLPLLRQGIVPDYVVAVDPAEALVKHFEGLPTPHVLADVPLVYAPGLHPRVLAAWPGTFVKANLGVPVYQELCPHNPKGVLFASGTVTHVAVDLGVWMGARRLCLVAADFCFPHSRSHAAGVTTSMPVTGPKIFTTDVSGRSVPSTLNLVGYRDQLVRYVERVEGVEFTRVGRRGAAMEGFEFVEGAP